MNFSHVIWDFNGTLLDDVKTGMKSVNVLLARRNMPLIENTEQYRTAFCFPIVKYYENLGFDFKKERYEDMAIEWMEQYLLHSVHAKLYNGANEALEYFKNQGVSQIILSVTERDMLLRQLSELGIIHYFDTILGLDNIHAYSKIDIAIKWASEASPGNALLIGDTLHDFDVAEQIGAKCVLISGGHQSKNALLSRGTIVLDSLCDLIDALTDM